jgi:hypothetical protein
MTFRRPFALVLINHMKDRFWPIAEMYTPHTLPSNSPICAGRHDAFRPSQAIHGASLGETTLRIDQVPSR